MLSPLFHQSVWRLPKSWDKVTKPMQYAILYYGSEEMIAKFDRRDDSIADVDPNGPDEVRSETRLDVQLLPTTTAVVVRGGPVSAIIDGPLIARKQDLLSLKIIEAPNLDRALAFVEASFQDAVGMTACEIRPLAGLERP
ncbi:hypothetical protein OZ411_21990 [Bradyrhizobium sp. Arg237L]|uniref:hypothetical protein n=1 Tax=Bradyrhizobium sp. Arg237L TaxID=3003352 RepID=UPI00249EFA08|nr:hypothetical protein [Bradyrhizobium sp. Arg237L]MDI4235484.1 hypothetical protein [Bradyrhizobium sp. Arg237L]